MEAVSVLVDKASQAPSVLWVASATCLVFAAKLYLSGDAVVKELERQGLRRVPVYTSLGAVYNLLTKNRLTFERENVKKYGRLHLDNQIGPTRLVVADPEVIRQILIKDFDVFTNHNLIEWANKYQRHFLVWLKDDHWKRVRSMMSPTFTSGKIKRMFRFLDGCADDLVSNFREQLDRAEGRGEGVVVNVLDVYGLFTMDGITTCCYGIKLRRQAGCSSLKKAATRDGFVENALKIGSFRPIRLLLAVSWPKWLLRLVGFRMTPESQFKPLLASVERMIAQRRDNPASKQDDLLQLLLEAKSDDQMELNELDQAENHHAGLTRESLLQDQRDMVESWTKGADRSATSLDQINKTRLSEIEVLSEAVFMLAAGMDTTRTLLTSCTYSLAFHPQVQERLYEELKRIAIVEQAEGAAGKRYTFDYESLTTCQYLDAVISETLRILPPATRTDRVASAEYRIDKYNVTLPKGTQLLIGINVVQNDPEYWHEPHRFDPERFMPANKDKIVPGSYLPFSMGPRHCIGMRFSLTEAKLGLAKVVMNFRFAPVEGLSFPPEPLKNLSLTFINDPRVLAVAREC